MNRHMSLCIFFLGGGGCWGYRGGGGGGGGRVRGHDVEILVSSTSILCNKDLGKITNLLWFMFSLRNQKLGRIPVVSWAMK